MSESKFGEPFTKTANGAEIFGAMLYDVRQSDGDIVVPDILHGLAKRIVDCLNACAPFDDPAAEIAAKDKRIAELEGALKAIMDVSWPSTKVYNIARAALEPKS